MILSPWLSMIFSENRFPLFRIMLWTLKIRTFTGYPMTALTERARGNISISYPVVI